MSQGGPGFRSLPERLLGAALLLLLAIVALNIAVRLLLGILWPLIGIAGGVILCVAGWHAWRSRRDGW